MIKCEYGNEMRISGRPVQIAAEFEELSREVRRVFLQESWEKHRRIFI